MTSCDVDVVSCKDKEQRESRSESVRGDALDEINVISHDPTSKSSIVRNTSLERDKSEDPVINNNLESDVADSQCNLESNCSQPKKKSKKRKRKRKRKSEVKHDVQIKKSSRKRKRRRRKKVKQDVQVESQLGSPPIKNATDSIKTCEAGPVEAVGDINADLEKDLPRKLTKWQKQRIRKKISKMKKKLNGTVINETAAKVESINVATHSSADQNELHSSELSKNEFERVKADETVAPVSAVENASSNCSNGEDVLLESKNITENKRNSDTDVPNKEDNHSQVSDFSIEGSQLGCVKKKLLILDINGLLADIVPYFHNKADTIISKKSVFLRPFCRDFLQFCFQKFNVGVWSSRTKFVLLTEQSYFHISCFVIIFHLQEIFFPSYLFTKTSISLFSSFYPNHVCNRRRNVDTAVDFLFRDSKRKLLFCWDRHHCTHTGFTTVENLDKPLVLKELKKLWDKLVPDLPWSKGEYNESNTLLLDDSPYKALCNPANTAIFPYPYLHKNAKDSSLGPGGDLRVYLEKLAEAPNVQEFVAQNPFGQRAITESNPSWGFYRRILTAAGSIKIADVASSDGAEQQSSTRDLE